MTQILVVGANRNQRNSRPNTQDDTWEGLPKPDGFSAIYDDGNASGIGHPIAIGLLFECRRVYLVAYRLFRWIYRRKV